MKGTAYDYDQEIDINQPYFKILGSVTSIIKVDNTKASFGKDKKSAYYKIKITTSTGKSHFIVFSYSEPKLKVGNEYVLQGYINSTNGINIYLNLRKAFNLESEDAVLDMSAAWSKTLQAEENNYVNQGINDTEQDNRLLSSFKDEDILKVVKEIFA